MLITQSLREPLLFVLTVRSWPKLSETAIPDILCRHFFGVTRKRFIEGENRSQITLFPEVLEAYIAEDNPVRVIEVFIDELDLSGLCFQSVEPHATGRPAYHPSTLLKLYVYGYLNRFQSSRLL